EDDRPAQKPSGAGVRLLPAASEGGSPDFRLPAHPGRDRRGLPDCLQFLGSGSGLCHSRRLCRGPVPDRQLPRQRPRRRRDHAPLRGLCAPEVNRVIPYQNGGKYIRPIALFQAQPKVFAIRMCKSNEPKGFKFSKPRGEQKGVVTISSKNLLEPLRAAAGEDWVPGKRYRVRGFWVA